MLVKGFMNIHSLLSNITGVIAPLGELSPMGYTFSREVGFYQDSQFPDYDLITLTTADSSHILIALSPDQVTQAIRVVNFIRTYIASRYPPYSMTNMRSATYDFFAGQIADLNIGELQAESNATLPQWISWKSTLDNTQYHIWLSDQAFVNQFDEFENVVVPALPNIDDFFLSTNVIADKVVNETIEKLIARIDTAKEGDPETYLRILNFDFIDPINRNLKIQTKWAVIVYGEAGDNIDSIKDALIEYILANSTRTRAQWEHIFPDIFRRTEFIILPRWDQISIPNMLTQTGLYSSLADPVESIDFCKNQIPFYTSNHIQNNIHLAPFPYKGLMLNIIDGQFNIDGKRDFKELYPDYLPVPTTSLDFNRMTLVTRDVLIALNQMLIIAETMTRYTFIPKPMKRVFRNDRLYLTRLIDNINFVVMPKSTLEG